MLPIPLRRATPALLIAAVLAATLAAGTAAARRPRPAAPAPAGDPAPASALPADRAGADARFAVLQSLTADACARRPDCKVYEVAPAADGRDGAALGAVLAQVAQRGAGDRAALSVVRLRAGATYRLERSATAWASLNLAGVRNLVLDGNGARLENSITNTFLAVLGSENVVLRDFSVRPDADLYTQGTVRAFDEDEALVEVDEGFPVLALDPGTRITKEFVSVGKTRFLAVVFTQDGARWTVPADDDVQPHFELEGLERVADAPRTLRVRLSREARRNAERAQHFRRALAQGERLKLALALPIVDPDKSARLQHRRGDADTGDWSAYVYLYGSHNLQLQRLRFAFTPTRLMVAYGVSGAFNVDDVTAAADTPGQLLSIMNGGLILKNNEHGPVITRLRIDGALDDMVNVRTSPALLQRVVAGDGAPRYHLQVEREQGARVLPGDRFAYYDPLAHAASNGPYRVVQVDWRGDLAEVTFDRPLADPQPPASDELRGSERAFATRFFNLDQAHAGFAVRDSQLVNGVRNAVICSFDCTVTGSRFSNIGLRVLFGVNRETGDGRQPLGPMPGRFVFRDNVVDGVSRAALEVRALAGARGASVAGIAPTWEISGNRFERVDGPLLVLDGFARSPCPACRIERNTPALADAPR